MMSISQFQSSIIEMSVWQGRMNIRNSRTKTDIIIQIICNFRYILFWHYNVSFFCVDMKNIDSFLDSK